MHSFGSWSVSWSESSLDTHVNTIGGLIMCWLNLCHKSLVEPKLSLQIMPK